MTAGRRAMGVVLAWAALGCTPEPPPPVAPATPVDADARRLVGRTRDLEREVRDLRQTVDRLAREAAVREGALHVALARLADRESELAALRATPPEALAEAQTELVDGNGETAPDYVRRLLDELLQDPANALEGEIDWPNFVATMLAADGPEAAAPSGLDPAAAAALLAALPADERESAFSGARDLLGELLGGSEGLAALKPTIGQHYRLGSTVRVELLARDAVGAEQRFTVSVARPEGAWRVVGLARR